MTGRVTRERTQAGRGGGTAFMPQQVCAGATSTGHLAMPFRMPTPHLQHSPEAESGAARTLECFTLRAPKFIDDKRNRSTRRTDRSWKKKKQHTGSRTEEFHVRLENSAGEQWKRTRKNAGLEGDHLLQGEGSPCPCLSQMSLAPQ